MKELLLFLLVLVLPLVSAINITHFGRNREKRSTVEEISKWVVSVSCRLPWEIVDALDWDLGEHVPGCDLDLSGVGEYVPQSVLSIYCTGTENRAHSLLETVRMFTTGNCQLHPFFQARKDATYSAPPVEGGSMKRQYEDATTQTSAPWHLDRIDQLYLPLNGTYNYALTGAGVKLYIFDTGARLSHNEFGGRATMFLDVVDYDPTVTGDNSGHGTHCQGLAAGSTKGIARGATLLVIRVLDGDGFGSLSGVIAGIIAVADAQAENLEPAVASFSLTGPADSLFDAYINSLVTTSKVAVAVAAGNAYGSSSCNYSPARASQVLTVAASTISDGIATFSNKGSCTKIIAPGNLLLSAYHLSDSSTAVMSGTSQVYFYFLIIRKPILFLHSASVVYRKRFRTVHSIFCDTEYPALFLLFFIPKSFPIEMYHTIPGSHGCVSNTRYSRGIGFKFSEILCIEFVVCLS
jgi:hypothetical protein